MVFIAETQRELLSLFEVLEAWRTSVETGAKPQTPRTLPNSETPSSESNITFSLRLCVSAFKFRGSGGIPPDTTFSTLLHGLIPTPSPRLCVSAFKFHSSNLQPSNLHQPSLFHLSTFPPFHFSRTTKRVPRRLSSLGEGRSVSRGKEPLPLGERQVFVSQKSKASLGEA